MTKMIQAIFSWIKYLFSNNFFGFCIDQGIKCKNIRVLNLKPDLSSSNTKKFSY